MKLKPQTGAGESGATVSALPPRRILIADDHPLVRRGLRQILAEAFPTVHFGETASVADTLVLLKNQPWDLLVLDINMPGRSGLDVLKELKLANVKTPTLVVSVHSEDQYALRALKAGAAGYLGKDSAPELFLFAVERILSGRTFISPALAEKLAEDLRGRKRGKSSLELLSDRELEVLRLIGSGQTVKEIAGSLGLSVKTVSTYRVRLLAKLRMKTNAEVMRFAMDERIVD
jgi:DNA-binding NarL/FixJ family response regulator